MDSFRQLAVGVTGLLEPETRSYQRNMERVLEQRMLAGS